MKSMKPSKPSLNYKVIAALLLLLVNQQLFAQCSLTCNSNLNVSLSAQCEATITPEVMIKNLNSTTCFGPFIIEIYDAQGNVIPSNPVVTAPYVGQSLDVRAIDNSTGQFCWGTIHIEDKQYPVFTCADDTIDCNDPIPSIAVVDNCDANPMLTFTETVTNLDCNDPDFNFLITRLYIATDSSGNQSSCEQIIRVAKPDLADVEFPINYDGLAAPMLDCENPDITPENTGYPTLNGAPLGEFCKINVLFTDQVIDICDGSYKILRKWTVLDCCTAEIITHFQVIKVVDQTGPMIVCPPSVTTSTDFDACSATVLLPNATATDNCAADENITISINWTFGQGQGPFLNVPLGTHVVTYTATDDCGNSSTCTMEVTVEDQIIPVAVCNPITVALVTDTAKAFAVSFDSGSSDNCAIDSFSVRRMEDTLFTNCVFFNCNDVDTTIMVVFRVCDTVGLCNECMVEVTVQDQTPPAILCPADVVLDCDEYPPSIAVTGTPTATDNCIIDSLYFRDDENLNVCNIGSITRTWYARDKQGLIDSCQQLIVIGDPAPATYSFPPDLAVQCLDDIDPSNTGMPMVNDNCANFPGIGNQDTLITVFPNCRYLLRRGWIIFDECNDTIVRHTQVINVEDTAAPVFNEAANSFDQTFACLGDVVFPPAPTATDNCNDEVMINLVSTDTFPGTCPDNYTIQLSYIASDSCGNLSNNFLTTITVNDSIAPSADPLPDLGPFSCPSLADAANINLVTGESDNCGGPVSVMHIGDATPSNCATSFIRTYQLSDQCGNTTDLTQVILLNDTIAPTANPIPDLGPFDCIADVDSADINVVTGESDNCGGNVTVSYIGDTGNPACAGNLIRTYRLDDGCGNTSDITQVILIDDQTPPVWDQQERALDLTLGCGSAIIVIPVPTATDQCNDAFITQVSDDTLTIACTNNYTRQITYTASDSCGNVSAPFIVQIVVNDSILPEWTTPMGSLNTTFVCSDEVVIPSPPVASDNCTAIDVMLVSDDTISLSCTDQYVRTLSYRAVDDCGNEAAIPFNVVLSVNDDVPPVWDVAPGDLDTTFICPSDIVNNLPTATDNCNTAMIELVTDDTLSFNCPNQYTRQLVYRAIDECGNAQSSLFPVIIGVNDTVPPVIDVCPANEEKFDFDNDCLESFNLTVTGSDNCGDVAFTYTRSDMPGLIFNNINTSVDFPVGTTLVTFFANDPCGNLDSCEVEFTVIDITAPEITCGGLNLFPFPGDVFTYGPENLLRTFDDCSPLNITFTSGMSFVSFSCADVLSVNPYVIGVEIQAEDIYGNVTSCTRQVKVFNLNCSGAPLGGIPLTALAGELTTPDGQYTPNVDIQLSGANDTMILSDTYGNYVFPEVEMYQDYMVTPYSNLDLLNGVNTLDLIVIAKHILQIESLDSPYKKVAADANRSGTITAFDMIVLSKVILDIEDEFTNNTSWRFIDTEYEFPAMPDPFTLPSDLPESIGVTDVSDLQLEMDFVSVKVGDVNNSVSVSGFTNQGDTRSTDELTVQLDNQLMRVGETYQLEFKVKDFQNIMGYQFTIDFDPQHIEFVGLDESSLSKTLGLNPDHFGWSALSEGKIRTNWFHHQAVDLPDDAVLFTLEFKAQTEIPISRTLQINSSELTAEAYNEREEKMNIQLQFTELNGTDQVFKLYQNRPNPFQETTVIPFILPKAGNVNLTISDLSGKVIRVNEVYLEAGYHEFNIEKNDLPESGVFFYQLKTKDQKATKKMILSIF